ncbi:MAG: EscU/YscU/HrcU family type III secretion system export apparatus switch protein [Planctomycetia bacterium]|nr:EscU/YscU/HrcU family type III secretion system export apparatus switch protein [Planctomycetia bacterium]
MSFLDDDQEARTERPTERHRREARERGMVARSAEFVLAFRALAALAVVSLWGLSFATAAAQLLLESFRQVTEERLTAETALPQASHALLWALAQMSTPLLIATGAVLVAHFVQVGWLWHPERAAPELARLSPISGLARVVSPSAFGRGLVSLLKLVLLAAICGRTVCSEWGNFSANGNRPLSEQVFAIGGSVTKLVSMAAIAVLVWGVADYILQRWRYERSLQMTKQELRQESKDVEGNPQIRHQRQVAARRLAATSD